MVEKAACYAGVLEVVADRWCLSRPLDGSVVCNDASGLENAGDSLLCVALLRDTGSGVTDLRPARKTRLSLGVVL